LIEKYHSEWALRRIAVTVVHYDSYIQTVIQAFPPAPATTSGAQR
jgi:hypothetical protein